MGFHRFLLVSALLSGLVLAVGCAVAQILPEDRPSSGVGGAPFDVTGNGDSVTSGSTGNGANGASLISASAGSAGGNAATFPDAGTNPATAFQSLCGGSQPACHPGHDCAPSETSGPPTDASSASRCQLVAGDGGVAAQCTVGGGAADGDPCLSGADCAAGLGCIATNVTSICRAYCCDGLESCPANTYCVKAAMAESPQSLIPVCTPAMKCALLKDSTCPSGQTCAIVRTAGTTSCVTPGTGTAGQPCPCAAGFTCNLVEGTCYQLCHIMSDDCGPHALCQGGSDLYPDGIGYCVAY